MIRAVKVVLAKELLDNLRDRRSLSAAFIFPLLGPVIIAALMFLLTSVELKKADEALKLTVQGAEHAPHLIDYLRQQGAEVVPPPKDVSLELAVKEGDLDVALRILPGYGDALRRAEPAPVLLVVDESRRASRVARKRAARLVLSHGTTIGRLRLMARGVSPSVADAVSVGTVDVSTPESRAAMLLGIMPYFIVLAIFLGGVYIAIDTTAGELERKSLEPLLMNPISRASLVTGKFAATMLFSTVGLGIATAGFWVVPHVVSTEAMGITIRLQTAVLTKIFLLVLPLTALASGLQMIVATFSRSFKEAQTYLSFLMMLPVIPGVFISMVPFKHATWMMAIPGFAEQLLINRLIRGEDLVPLHVGICISATAVAATACVLLAIKLYSGERMFRR